MPHHPTTTRRGFTLIGLFVVIALIALLIGILLPALGASRRTARQMANNTQLRGIHQGLVTFAQSNKRSGRDGYFTGLDSQGDILPNGPATGDSGDGTEPGARVWPLIDGNYFTPGYTVNPADTHTVELAVPPGGPVPPVHAMHHSYAWLAIPGVGNAGIGRGHRDTRDEWSETLNTQAVVLSDRAIGTGPQDISSLWTTAGRGDWRGGIVRNDNSTSFDTVHQVEHTKYGPQNANAIDDIFADDPDAVDAHLVHDDATTAYSEH